MIPSETKRYLHHPKAGNSTCSNWSFAGDCVPKSLGCILNHPKTHGKMVVYRDLMDDLMDLMDDFVYASISYTAKNVINMSLS